MKKTEKGPGSNAPDLFCVSLFVSALLQVLGVDVADQSRVPDIFYRADQGRFGGKISISVLL